MLRLFVLVACLAVVYGDSVLSQCVNNNGDLPASFEFVGCSSSPCAVHQGESTVMHVKFIAPHDSEWLIAQLNAYITILGTELPIFIDLNGQEFACNHLTNSACPVTAGQDIDYSVHLPIEYDPMIPIGVVLSLELRVADETRINVFCARSTIQVMAPRS